MRKLIAGMNMTLDGFCDHTSMTADDEIHDYYSDQLRSAGTLIYGRITYQLMASYWPAIVKNPTGEKATDDFAVAIDNIEKVVFSHTLKSVEWESARIAQQSLKEEIDILRQQKGKDIFIGSPGLIVAAMNLNLVDELRLCVHPTMAAGGLSLFKNITNKIELKLLKTKTFGGGAVTFYYKLNNH